MPTFQRVNKSSKSDSSKILSLLFLVGLAALAQIFLAQSEKNLTLWIGFLLYAAALWKWRRLPASVQKDPAPFSFNAETVLFFLILGLGFMLRIFRIDEIPAGMHTDQGLTGLSALRILKEGWNPFPDAWNYQVPEPLLFCQLAGWFGLVGSSYFTFHLFFVLLSLAAFPLIYWTFRQLAGPKTALLSLFLLSVMRWNWIETRNGYPSVQVSLYLFGVLSLWLYGLKIRRVWPFYLSALCAGVGLYTYQAFKAAPLLVFMIWLYEYFTRWKGSKIRRPQVWIYLALVLAITFPLIHYDWQNKTLGNRESDLFIGKKIMETGSLKPLWDVWSGTALMFNREGDANPRHNIPGRRMLDDVTGVFFVLGLGLAWRLRKKPEGFYPLAGFFVMSLPGLLSTDIAHSNRLVVLTPFVAYFAATAMGYFYQKIKPFSRNRAPILFLSAILLLFIAAENAYTYFVLQANNEECQSAFGPEQTYIGRSIEIIEQHFPPLQYYFIDPSYFGNNTVEFLAYKDRPNVLEMNLQDWAAGRIPKDKTAVVLLGIKKSGWAHFLESLCPGAIVLHDEKSQDIYECTIPKKTLSQIKPWTQGLRGVYRNSKDWAGKPAAVQIDPVLNFTSKLDFPFTQPPPFRIRWSGTLETAQAGDYQFQFLASDKVKLWIDGKPIVLEKPTALAAGPHPLVIHFEKDSGDELALNFIWKKPGSDKWEIVPAAVFGTLPNIP